MRNRYPVTFAIFGSTGDLSRKKLLPALLDLYGRKALLDNFHIVGVSRRDWNDEKFREFVAEALAHKGHEHSEEIVTEFLQKVFYHKGDIYNADDYTGLAEYLHTCDEVFQTCSNKLFYLAVPPDLYEPVFNNIARSGLTVPCAKPEQNDGDVWTRVLVEKPFGSDIESAESLDNLLGDLFDEKQIFRIDHYLAKETIQNILMFRFSNALFEPVWTNEHIEKIHIKLFEKNSVKDRGAFYDSIGALRDVGQNHILQMLALIAMEKPAKLDTDSIRNARFEVLKQITSPVDVHNIVRAQYKGYQDVDGVQKDSKTETYFRMALGVNNERWKGVPFIIESGKALNESKTEISIHFKENSTCICPDHSEIRPKNVVKFRIQPDEGISIRFYAKKPGFDFELESRELNFNYSDGDTDTMLPDAYERILYDCIRGDQMLFASTHEVASQWNIISPICRAWKKIPLITYEPGIEPEKITNNKK